MASVDQDGWPYVQFRGGPPGFLKVLDERTLGYADFRGNMQLISVGNLRHDERDPDYGGQVRRVVLFRVEAFDWNCPQHITPRFTPAEIEAGAYQRLLDRDASRGLPPE